MTAFTFNRLASEASLQESVTLVRDTIIRNDMNSSEVRGLVIKLNYDQVNGLVYLLNNSLIDDTANSLRIKLRIKRAKLTLQDLITRTPKLITENEYRLANRRYGDLLYINSAKELTKALRMMGTSDEYYLRSLSPTKLNICHTNVEFYHEMY